MGTLIPYRAQNFAIASRTSHLNRRPPRARSAPTDHFYTRVELRERSFSMLPTRRRLLQGLLLSPAFRGMQAARRGFWEIKDPGQWSSEEKRILLAQSPWAREGAVTFDVGPHREPPSGPYDVPATRAGGMPNANPTVPMGEALPPRPEAPGQPVQFRVVARWESAAPIRLAGGPELPEGAAEFYVIGLRGLPLMPSAKAKPGESESNSNQAMLDALRQNSRLERKDKPDLACNHLLTRSRESSTELLLFFPRDPDPITVADKLVTLESRFGPFHLTVRFLPKEMMFNGTLAL